MSIEGEDVVDVGGDDQTVDRKPHTLGNISGEYIAEIASRNGESDLAPRCPECHRGREVIHDLCDDTSEVDRVDAREPHPVAKGVVVEQPLYDGLAVVERALNGQGMDVVVLDGRHHPALDVGDPPDRE